MTSPLAEKPKMWGYKTENSKKLRFYNPEKIEPQNLPATAVFAIEFDHISGSIELKNLNVCYFSIGGIIHTDAKLLLHKIRY